MRINLSKRTKMVKINYWRIKRVEIKKGTKVKPSYLGDFWPKEKLFMGLYNLPSTNITSLNTDCGISLKASVTVYSSSCTAEKRDLFCQRNKNEQKRGAEISKGLPRKSKELHKNSQRACGKSPSVFLSRPPQ